MLTLDKLDPEITYRLATEIAPVSEIPADALIVLTDKHTLLGLIIQIITVNKQSSSLKDKYAKAIRGD